MTPKPGIPLIPDASRLLAKATPLPWREVWEHSDPEGDYPAGIKGSDGEPNNWVVRHDDDLGTDLAANNALIVYAVNRLGGIPLIDVELLRDAIHILDERNPGIFNDIAIDETVERPIAGLLAVIYQSLAGLPVEEGERPVACNEWFGGQYAHDYCRRDPGHDGPHSSVRFNADEADDDPISDSRQPEDGPPPGRWPR